MGFTLTLQPGVPGVTSQDLTLMPAVAIATAMANTDDMPNTRYTVTTQARLAPNQTYMLTITKAGYNITSPTFMRSLSSEARITKMALTVEGLKVEGTINGTDITFPYGARGTGTTSTLTGVVSLELSAGAAVDGTSPTDGMPQTYNSSPSKSITVLAEDGTTKQTYTVVITAYDATSNPYGVYTAAHLYEVRNGLTANYRLMQDLALPNASSGCSSEPFSAQQDYCSNGWKPIGTDTPATSQFTGTFDGNGHSISNLFIQRSTDYVGLFGFVGTAGTIRNLGVHIAAAGVIGKDKVGGLVGYSGGTITNAYATGAVTGGSNVGGLVGYSGGTITNCYATGAVSGSSAVGGLVGSRGKGSITTSYYPTGRPTGVGGKALDSGATQPAFKGFAFTGTTPAWKWVNGQWPSL